MATNENCLCSNTECERHGNCPVCLEYHKKDGTKTACVRMFENIGNE